ncbi:MAG: helix-turn-helix transcriptional regulator [Nitrospirota bacterium]
MEKALDLYSQDTQCFAAQRAGHGILIVTLDGRILWTDDRATELCRQMRVVTEKLEGILPLRVLKLVQEIAELLELRNHPKDWEAFNVKRVIKGGETHIFVAGIGLPAGVGHETKSTVLLTLDVIAPRKSVSRLQAFQLTAKEITVAGLLLKGSTNKEIAHAIGVTVQTAKEHVKHIMEKTRTNTRTGIVMAIAGPAETSSQGNRRAS